MKLIGSRLIAQYYTIFLCLNIYLPKIDLGFGQFYVFDFTNIIIFVYFLGKEKVQLGNKWVTLSYSLFMALCSLTYLIGFFDFGFIDLTSLFRLVKFTVFLIFLILPVYLYREFDYEDLLKIVYFQITFIILSGLYTLFHMLFFPVDSNYYAWSYDNRYRLIGLTSYSLDLNGNINLGGSTSVSMGVFVAFIFFILLSLYKFTRKTKYLFLSGVIFLFEFLTYSRAGILTLIAGTLYYSLLNLRPFFILRVIVFLFLLFGLGFAFDLFNKLGSFGTITKISNFSLDTDSSIGIRIQMLKDGANYFLHFPLSLLWGTGYGEDYTMAAIGHPHLEGLIPTILFTSGFFAVSILLFHFYSLWYLSTLYSKLTQTNFSIYLYATRLFVPGWFLSALAAGNTFQTDFYFPLIYFIFFTSFMKIKNSSN